MRYLILTDLEGVAGTDRFTQTRTSDSGPEGKGPSMDQLAREVDACVAGILAADPQAEVDVIDGHGSGGLKDGALQSRCTLLPREGLSAFLRGPLGQYSALLFVGQHAMAGTINAPLCHTFSSLTVAYYRLNGVFVGEFGFRALGFGLQGIPTIFLAGDDKAALEAQMFIPEIETAITKTGLGLEKAEHLSAEQACQEIAEGAERAVRRMGQIPPFTALQPPFVLEVRHYAPLAKAMLADTPHRQQVDAYTYRVESDTYERLIP